MKKQCKRNLITSLKEENFELKPTAPNMKNELEIIAYKRFSLTRSPPKKHSKTERKDSAVTSAEFFLVVACSSRRFRP
jgi:hypothetical protein